jgi:hypothetical protein
MQTKTLIQTSICGAVLMAAALTIAQGQETSKNRILLNYRSSFNIEARFNAPALEFASPPPLSGSGVTGNPVAREYEDGFVRVDSTGNAGGYTWYWAYGSADQLQEVGLESGGTLLMHQTVSASGPGDFKQTDDPQHGFEIVYQRELGWNEKSRVGFELAFNYTRMDIKASRNLAAQLTRIVDAYSLEGITPPLAPYAGTYSGPGPLLGDRPTRTTETVEGGRIANSREIDGALYGLRLGPYFEFPLCGGVSFLVLGGFAGGFLDADFSYRDTISLTSSQPVLFQSGSASRSEFLAGAYAGGMVNVALSDTWNVFVGAQWQYLKDWTQQVGNRKATLDLSNTVFVSAGLAWSF